MLSGGSKLAYWASNFIVDLFFHGIPALSALSTIWCLKIDALDTWYLYATFSITNPLFIYAVSFFFTETATASALLRVFYFTFGAIAPVTMQLLYVITKFTRWWYFYLEKYFIYIPVFNMNYGYISIVNRKVYELMFQKQGEFVNNPYHWELAGKSIYYM